MWCEPNFLLCSVFCWKRHWNWMYDHEFAVFTNKLTQYSIANLHSRTKWFHSNCFMLFFQIIQFNKLLLKKKNLIYFWDWNIFNNLADCLFYKENNFILLKSVINIQAIIYNLTTLGYRQLISLIDLGSDSRKNFS